MHPTIKSIVIQEPPTKSVLRTQAVVVLLAAGCSASDTYAGSEQDRSALSKASTISPTILAELIEKLR